MASPVCQISTVLRNTGITVAGNRHFFKARRLEAPSGMLYMVAQKNRTLKQWNAASKFWGEYDYYHIYFMKYD